VQLDLTCYVFSGDPDSRALKNLRHYIATELISAGVDVRTVAGRLGHGLRPPAATCRIFLSVGLGMANRPSGAVSLRVFRLRTDVAL
jgi:hypothetical protein